MGLERVDSKVVWILTEPEMDESLGWLINLGWLKAEMMAVWIWMVSDWE